MNDRAYHCWYSAQQKAVTGSAVYCVNGSEVDVTEASLSRDTVNCWPDTVYLGVGTYVRQGDGAVAATFNEEPPLFI